MGMARIRTDLALEARDLWRGGEGVASRERRVRGCGVTEVEVKTAEAARGLGKPMGRYVTVDLGHESGENGLEETAEAVAEELRRLLPASVQTALVVGLGNAAMTPDAIGPQTAEHVLATRHLTEEDAFADLTAVSVLVPGVLGRTGMEAAETIRGAARTVRPDVIVAVDALASRSLSRLCATVQLSDTGIVPGSGVGNSRRALNRTTLGVPVIAVGVPTVVDAATLTADVLEEAGRGGLDPAALGEWGKNVMVTPRDVDARIRDLSRMLGYAIDLALQPLSYRDLCALLS